MTDSASPGPLSGLPGFGVPKTDTMFSAPRAPSHRSIAAAGRYGACKKPHLYLRRERPSKKHPQGKPCWVCKNDTGIASATTPTYAFRAWQRNVEYKTKYRRSWQR